MPERDAEHRGRRRDRALVRTLGSSAGLQIATIAGAILSLPFVTRTLSSSEYGVLATITGFVVLLGFADLGVGAALTSRLAEAEGQDEPTSPQELISTALAAASIAAAGVLAVGSVCTLIIPWQSLLGAPSIPTSTLRACILCLVISTAASIVGSLGQRALYGIQRGSVANHWLAAATLAGAGTSILVALWGGPLWAYVLAVVGSPAVVSIFCTWWTFRFTRLRVRPRLRSVTKPDLLNLAGTSGWFFAITLAGAIGYQTDSLVVAAVLGASSAGIYSVALRVFGLITQSIYPALLQLWPAFAEALGRGDIRWIRTRFWWSTVLASLASALIGTVLVIVGPALVGKWLTPELAPSRSLLAAMALFTTYGLGMAPVFFLLNAIGRVRAHALMAIAVSCANIPLSIALTHSIGISGPVFGSLLSSILLAGVPGAVIVHRLFRDASASGPSSATSDAVVP